MFTKEHDLFIDLKKKIQNTAIPAEENYDKAEPKGPSLFINNSVKLPLDEEDLDKVLFAEIKVKLCMLKKVKEKENIEYSYDLEVIAIRFTS